MNLDELLKEAITKPEKRSLFLQMLIKSDVYVICKKPVKQDEINGGVSMELVTTQNPDGDIFWGLHVVRDRPYMTVRIGKNLISVIERKPPPPQDRRRDAK